MILAGLQQRLLPTTGLRPIQVVLALLLVVPHVPAADPAQVREWLAQPLIEPDRPLWEVQSFIEKRIPRVPATEDAAAWRSYADALRTSVLEEVVFRGQARQWRQAKGRVEWLDTMAGGPGYRIRKLRYEAVPGLWIPALLYEPEKLTGKVPVVLNVNGHDGKGKAAEYKQRRCIHQARQGLIALNAEWLGMGQLADTNNLHYRMNQLDLCGTSGLAPFFLALKRALDLLLDHPHADPDRVGVAGLSGGGWQTIFISSLDERVTFANPVAGYSSFLTRVRHLEDLGDSEQTPSDLATVADYTHLTALLAPRPALLTFNAHDNCCFASGHAMPPLVTAAQPVYDLLGVPSLLATHVNEDPGDHNFGADNRQALYRAMAKAFHLDEDAFVREIDPGPGEIQTAEALRVEMPSGNQTLSSLASSLSHALPRTVPPPVERAQAAAWQESLREQLVARANIPPYRASGTPVEPRVREGLEVQPWKFAIRTDWTIPAVEISPPEPRKTIVALGDEGRVGLAPQVFEHLIQGHRVIAPDLLYFGESRISQRDFLFALLIAATGERLLGIQAGQLNAVARWTEGKYRHQPVEVHAYGPRASLIALVAAASTRRREDQATHLHGALGSLRQVLEQNWSARERPEWFCFGLLEAMDLDHMVALAAPSPVRFHQPSPRVRAEMDWLQAWYALLGSPSELWGE